MSSLPALSHFLHNGIIMKGIMLYKTAPSSPSLLLFLLAASYRGQLFSLLGGYSNAWALYSSQWIIKKGSREKQLRISGQKTHYPHFSSSFPSMTTAEAEAEARSSRSGGKGQDSPAMDKGGAPTGDKKRKASYRSH